MEKRVAIIGTAFRLPSTDRDNLWKDLIDKKDLVTHVEETRWNHQRYLHPDKNHPGTSYTFSAGSIGDISGFDAQFFGISNREAALMDPQQRLLLELTWESLENAGIKPSSVRGSETGVYVGIASADYSYRMADDLSIINATVATGNTASIAANRISYVFDFKGPSMALDTACSSSLVAFHQACQAIRSGEVNQAVTGGVSLHLHPYGFISFSKATMLSPDGRCKVFDEDGNGYVRSEGGGIFVLKDYELAIADGDPILAVVAGSAVNTDGHKSGLTVPSADAQVELMEKVAKNAGLTADDFDYLEAHGTGTAVGDPIETSAIGRAIGQRRAKALPIGSVKGNMGHLETASGVAGLIKAICTLQNRTIPPTIGMSAPNPNIHFDDWNIRPVTESEPLPDNGQLTVGVNSFGFGGANAHVILQSVELQQPIDKAQESTHLLPVVVSAATQEGVKQAALDIADALKSESLPLYDVAYQLRARRDTHQEAAVIFAATRAEAVATLNRYGHAEIGAGIINAYSISNLPTSTVPTETKRPVFVFSGNGCQWEKMGANLLEQSATFRACIESIDALFSKLADFSLIEELQMRNGSGRMTYTEIAQPTLFALQMGVVKMLEEKGITPGAVVGHSVGEIAAACVSGALSLQDAVEVIYHRSQSQGLTKGKGQMTAVGLSADDTLNIIKELDLNNICIAGDNSHRGATVAGCPKELTEMEEKLASDGVFFRRLDLDYAFHSPVMDEIEATIKSRLDKITPTESTIPFFSTVTGELCNGFTLDADYWWKNIREPVQFSGAVDSLLNDNFNTFVEVGGHPVLRSYLKDALKSNDASGLVIPTIERQLDTVQQLTAAEAQVLLSGAEVDEHFYFPVVGQHTQLPNYPWQKESLWHPQTSESNSLLTQECLHPLLGSEVPGHTSLWESVIDTPKFPWLADHVVGDSVVFPGTGYFEIMLAAAAKSDSSCLELEDIEISLPLLLSDDTSKKVRTKLSVSNGQVSIESRTLLEDEKWSLHAKGRVISEPTGEHLKQSPLSLPDRDADFTKDSHLSMTSFVGLNYGDCFQAVDKGWCQNDVIIGLLKRPDSLTIGQFDHSGGYWLHPALMDCGLQLIIHHMTDRIDQSEGTTYVPIRVSRLHLNCHAGAPYQVEVRLLNRTAHALSANFKVFDREGNTLAVLEEARFRAVQAKKASQLRIDYLEYELTPVDSPISVDIHPVVVSQHIDAELAAPATQAQLERYNQEVDPLLDSLFSAFLREALEVATLENGLIDYEALQQLSDHQDNWPLYLNWLLEFGTESGILNKLEDRKWSIQKDPEAISAQLIWQALIADYPDYFDLIQRCGRKGLQLLERFSPDSRNNSTLDEEPPSNRYADIYSSVIAECGLSSMHKALEEIVHLYQQRLQSGQRVKILEVSSSSPRLLNRLNTLVNHDTSDLSYATIGKESIEASRVALEDCPFVNIIDLETEDDKYSIEHQLIIIQLDFASSSDTLNTLEKLNRLVSEDATVIFIGLSPTHWMDFLAGQNKHWWSRLQNNQLCSQQNDANSWIKTLDTLGFRDVSLTDHNRDSGPFVITARPPITPASQTSNSQLENQSQSQSQSQSAIEGDITLREDLIEKSNSNRSIEDDKENAVATKHALILNASHSALSQQLIPTLKSGGFGVIIPQQDQSITSLLNDTASKGLSVTDVIHLPCAKEAHIDDMIAAQNQRCIQLKELANIADSDGPLWTLWVVTENVAGTYPGHTKTDVQASPDSMIWGFGRTLMNESTSVNLRLVDLSDNISSPLINRLYREICTPSLETELFINHNGVCLAPRLRYQMPPGSRVSTDNLDENLTLNFSSPGQLKNLEWQKDSLHDIAPNEVRVEVKATGLNFRDVMYTLGLLSDEAIENGFAGPTLGLEFSGRVVHIGREVSGFAPGDDVVGFGPACFSRYATTTENAVAKIPEGIDFESAATIPSTFFTVYYALYHLARLQPGERVLIHGAAGGVGIAAIQIARWLGAEIYATAGSPEKIDFLKLMGVDNIFDSRSTRFAEDILRTTPDGKGVDAVLNSLAGEAINQNLRVLKPFGRFLELGKRDFYENTHIGLRPFRNNISYFGIDADQLMSERPELTQQLFTEMMTLFKDGTLSPLPYKRFSATHVADAFRYMQQAKQIGKVVVTYDDPPQAKSTVSKNQKELDLTETASYLVTGGLAGFGLATAEWLISKGARHLILLSRSGAQSEESKTALARFRSQGVNVLDKACDVTDQTALNSVFEEATATMPPIKGIVHAAAVIEDAMVQNLSQELLNKVLIPKVKGAFLLDKLSRNLDLDFFVLYSSATTLLGNPGQSAYVAGNHWMESLAAERRTHGLPATCARWGAIEDVGFLARNTEIRDSLKSRIGGDAIPCAKAFSSLEKMMTTNTGNLGVIELEWGPLSRFLLSSNDPKFKEIALNTQEEDQGEDNQLDIQTMLAELSEEQLHERILQILASTLGSILMIAPDAIDPNKSMYDMGLDSLMGVELLSSIESKFGVQIPAMAISETPTLNKLSLRLIQILQGKDKGDDKSDQVRRVAAIHGVDSSEKDIDAVAKDLTH